MYYGGFEIESLEIVPLDARRRVVQHLVDALIEINKEVLARFELPPFYHSGVVYKPQTMGRDRWQDAARLLKTGMGACEDLVAWRVAELQMAGENAHAEVISNVAPNGSMVVYHVVVRRANSEIEDPSALLGMQDASGAF